MEEINIKNLKPIDGIQKILDRITQSKYVKLTTNGQLGTFLMDGFASEGIPVDIPMKPSPEPYKIFKLKKLEIFIDPMMKWSDTRLLLVDKKGEKEEILVVHDNNLV